MKHEQTSGLTRSHQCHEGDSLLSGFCLVYVMQVTQKRQNSGLWKTV